MAENSWQHISLGYLISILENQNQCLVNIGKTVWKYLLLNLRPRFELGFTRLNLEHEAKVTSKAIWYFIYAMLYQNVWWWQACCTGTCLSGLFFQETLPSAIYFVRISINCSSHVKIIYFAHHDCISMVQMMCHFTSSYGIQWITNQHPAAWHISLRHDSTPPIILYHNNQEHNNTTWPWSLFINSRPELARKSSEEI